MSRIDYWGIESEIAEILRADSALEGVNVSIEDEVNMEAGPWVIVYLERRDPTEGQPLAAGTKVRFKIKFIIWCFQYSLDSMANACNARDELIGKVEIALMTNRTLNDKVGYTWIEGGEIQSARLPETAGYVAGGEIVLLAEVTASI